MMARAAEELLGQRVDVRRMEDVRELDSYDGIWACASLLHVAEEEVPATLARMWASLKPGGVFYLSFKHGEVERTDGERHFTDANDARLREWVVRLPELATVESWTNAGPAAGA